MIVAACPSCRENVTVPIDARPTSIVRCPLCSAEFPLEQFLAQLPPPLIVLPQPDAPSDSSSPLEGLYGAGPVEAHDAVAQDLVEQDLVEQDVSIDLGVSAGSDAGVPAFDFTPAAREAVGGPRELVRRPANRRTNTPWEIVKIVGGALLAVPAAQIILWWCVPYSWKRDLLQVGPAVSRVAPWIVPAKFHARAADDRAEQVSDAVDGRSPGALPRRLNDRDRVARSELPALGDAAAGSATAPPDGGPSDVRPMDGPPSIAPATAIDLEPSSGGPESERVSDGATAFHLADLRAALERAVQASVAWDTAPNQAPEDRAALTDDFYGAFAGLGEVVTFLAQGEPGARQLVADVNHLLTSLQHQPKKLVLIGSHSAEWLDQPTRPNRGVVLFGTVGPIHAQGGLFVTELELASQPKRTVPVFSRIDPAGYYAPGDRLLMLGALISDPARNLPGYEGQAAEIVFGGFPARLR